MRCKTMLFAVALFGVAAAAGTTTMAADVRHFSFAYDQPHTTAYGIAADTFANKLAELSHGTLVIDQFPGAQLGQEPQVLQKLRTGDVDFAIASTANSATVQPESGVFSIHFVFRSEDHLKKALADPALVAAFRDMMNLKVEGAHTLALGTMGFRDIYSKREIHRLEDLKNVKVRVQATATEGHDVSGLWRANHPHAVWRRLYLVADRCRRSRRERHQRLSDEQALRGGADHVTDPARGEQQCRLGQRQGVEQPQ